jgi:hypothetical protein
MQVRRSVSGFDVVDRGRRTGPAPPPISRRRDPYLAVIQRSVFRDEGPLFDCKSPKNVAQPTPPQIVEPRHNSRRPKYSHQCILISLQPSHTKRVEARNRSSIALTLKRKKKGSKNVHIAHPKIRRRSIPRRLPNSTPRPSPESKSKPSRQSRHRSS